MKHQTLDYSFDEKKTHESKSVVFTTSYWTIEEEEKRTYSMTPKQARDLAVRLLQHAQIADNAGQ